PGPDLAGSERGARNWQSAQRLAHPFAINGARVEEAEERSMARCRWGEERNAWEDSSSGSFYGHRLRGVRAKAGAIPERGEGRDQPAGLYCHPISPRVAS